MVCVLCKMNCFWLGMSRSNHVIWNRGRSRGFKLNQNRTLHLDQGSDMYMYIFSFLFFDQIYNISKQMGKNLCAQDTGQVLVNIMTGHCCQRFLWLWCMSSCASASSPFICHSGTSFKAEPTKEPAIVAEGYLMCQCFSYMHSAAGYSADLGTVIKLLSINILIQNNCSFFFRYFPCHVTQWLHSSSRLYY